MERGKEKARAKKAMKTRATVPKETPFTTDSRMSR